MKEKEEINLFKANIHEEIRPWGKFRSFPYQMAKSIKIITVNPGASLSLQYHHHRSEFWVVLDAGLEITVGERVWQPRVNEEIFIPRKTPHRLRCLGSQPGRVLEIWIGDSNEEDIVRLQDDYGRI
jgi:mannose-6-phosphate isomerase-like protein (cupin superfamily)